MQQMQQTRLRPGDSAPDIRVEDGSGAAVQLSDLWREKPVLIAFLRHYG